MNCAELEELIWLAIDADLTPAERQLVDAHAAACAACRQRIADARRVASGLRQLGAPRAPQGFAAATIERSQSPPALRPLARWRMLAAAAVVVIVAGIGWSVWSQRARSGGPGAELELAAAPRAADAASPAEPGAALAEPVPKRLEARKDQEETDRDADSATRRPGAAAPAAAADEKGDKQVDDETDDEADDEADTRADAAEAAWAPMDEAATPATPPSLDQVVRDAGSAKEALAQLLLSAKVPPAEGTLKKLEESKAKQDAGQVAGASADAGKAPVPSGPSAGLATVEFLVVPRDAAATRDWLRARGDVASEGGVAIVDVAPAEVQSLLEALEKAKLPAEQLDAPAWLERAAPAIAREQLPRSKPRGARGDGAGGTGPVGGNAKDAGKDGAGEAAKERAAAPGAPAGKAAAPGSELQAAPKSVRVILWLAPPPAASGERR